MVIVHFEIKDGDGWEERKKERRKALNSDARASFNPDLTAAAERLDSPPSLPSRTSHVSTTQDGRC